MHKIAGGLFSLVWIWFSIYMVVKPDVAAKKIKAFYSNYPLVRYAGKKQLTSRPIFIKVLGIVFLFLSIAMFLGIIFLE